MDPTIENNWVQCRRFDLSKKMGRGEVDYQKWQWNNWDRWWSANTPKYLSRCGIEMGEVLKGKWTWPKELFLPRSFLISENQNMKRARWMTNSWSNGSFLPSTSTDPAYLDHRFLWVFISSSCWLSLMLHACSKVLRDGCWQIGGLSGHQFLNPLSMPSRSLFG